MMIKRRPVLYVLDLRISFRIYRIKIGRFYIPVGIKRYGK
jgi:hypothetical protein